MEKCVIVRYGEISLKGKNRIVFERKLVSNIKDCLKKNKIKFEEVKRIRNRIIIYTNDKCDCLKYVFGILSFSPAIKTESNIESIKKSSSEFIKKLNKDKSFRISAKNLGNKKLRSMDVNIKIGDFVRKKTKARVNLEKFDFELGIEIVDGDSYIFVERKKGFGGLPVGIEGKVAALIESKKDILAALTVMKRGCSVFAVGFKEFNIDLLKKYCYGYDIDLIKIKKLKDVEKLNIKALVVGQNLDDFKEIKTKLAVLRPLIGFSEKEIKKKIKLFDV